MADIGKLSVKVSASSADLATDFKKTEGIYSASADSLASMSRAKGQSIGKAFGDGIRNASNFLGDAFTNPLKVANDVLLGGAANLVAKIPVIGGLLALPLDAASAGITSAIGIYEENADRIKKLGIGASKTGLNVEDFQLFSKMTGGAEGAEKAWAKFNQRLAEASMSSEGARTTFDKFGMDGKSVAQDFESDFTGALGRVADRFRLLPATMRSSFLRENFGRGGLEMAPMLMKGSAGVNDLKEMMERSGVTVNAGLVDSVKQVGKAKKQIDMLWEGFGNQVTMAVAPALAVISEKIGKLPGGFAGLADTIIDTVGTAAEFVADTIDGWANGDTAERLAPYWDKFKAKAGETIDWIVDKLTDGIGSALHGNVLEGVTVEHNGETYTGKEFAELRKKEERATQKMAEGMMPKLGGDKAAEDVGWDEWDWGATKAGGKALQVVKDTLAEIRKRVKSGGGDLEFDPLAPYQDRINKLNDATKGPLGEFKKDMGDINDLLKKVDEAAGLDKLREGARELGGAGGFGDIVKAVAFNPIDKEAAELSAFASLQKLRSAAGGSQRSLAGAMEQGSTQAYSAIAQWEANKPEDVQQEMKRLQQQLLEQQKEQVRVGRAVLEATRNNNLKVGGKF